MSSENKPFKLYSNDASVAVSFFDISMLFKISSPDGTDALGTIAMSPQHAKAFANILLQNLGQYEELFGEIPVLDKEKFNNLQLMGTIGGEPQ